MSDIDTAIAVSDRALDRCRDRWLSVPFGFCEVCNFIECDCSVCPDCRERLPYDRCECPKHLVMRRSCLCPHD